ncbi:tatAE: twin arginine-targeting protein translocase, TatA/E family [Rubrobacter radiotolerans]|uniref:Sec-independent protein translocase protein TatA n=2 Tax=Rubrobacter radiotolerans TaxID=42256 RepID=A0A023X4W0_RUBRA|nr:tatAE: twin arginine-targeting protein translocase, TatA/E family [Rubrobacter radiotolerans]
MEDGRKTLPVLAGPGEVYNPASYGVNRGESQMGLTSPSHLIILLVILLLLFGAKKIPELARGLGQGMREFRQGVNDKGEVEGSDGTSRSVESESRTQERAEARTDTAARG